MRRWILFPALVVATLAGCAPNRPQTGGATADSQAASASRAHSPIRFEDVSETAGIEFTLGHNGRTPLNILETSGGGAAFLDYNQDNRLDILLVGPQKIGLYRNEGDHRFRNVTADSGLDSAGYWMGCATGDYDGDGRVDILLTGYQRTALFRNHHGRFAEVTRKAGIDPSGWSLSGAFADYDLDGRLDLYISRYLTFNARTPQLCRLGQIHTACGPEIYEPEAGVLYRNIGGGKFQDTTAAAGVVSSGKTWGAIFSDLNGDRYPDLYLANDMTPCDLLLNRSGKFTTAGAQASIAYDANGHLQGAMGVDTGDYDNDGRLDLLVTTYFAQATSLYRNEGQELFSEVGTPAGLGRPGMPYVGFGAAFLDADNDGWMDVFVANGHVRDNVREHDSAQGYAQPMQVFRNDRGRFSEVSADAGATFGEPLVGRGVAVGDYDADGRLDLLVCNLEGEARLLRNMTPAPNHWLRVRLRGDDGNTQGLGTRVEIDCGGERQVREVRTNGSVLSAHEPVAHFGLGQHATVDRLTVHWPDGTQTTRRNVPADRILTVDADHP